MWPLKSLVYFVLFWLGCGSALFNPIWGVVTYMMVYQANPTVTWWGLPLMRIGMRFSLLAAAFTIVGLIFSRKKVPINRPAFSLWEAGVFGLVAIAALNLLIGPQTTSLTLYTFEKLWKVLLFVLILTQLLTTRHNLRLALSTLVAGSFYIGYDAFTAPPTAFVFGRLETIGGPDFSTTSGAAAHMVAMVPLIGAAALTSRDWRWKLFCTTTGILLVNAAIMCRTRSAFVGIVAGSLAALLITPRARRFRIYFLLALGGIGTLRLADEHFWERMATLIDARTLETDMAAVSRKEIWRASVDILADHPTGIGPGNFTSIIGDYAPEHRWRATHNTLVACFVELGIQGGIVFLLMALAAVRYLYRSSRLAVRTAYPVETQILAYAFLVSFVTYFVTSLGTQRLYCESFWWVMALPLCLYRVTLREVAERGDGPMLLAERSADIESIPQNAVVHAHAPY